jgi:hypothetical protein
LTLSFDSTTNGSLGTKPVALKLDLIFACENASLKTFAKVAIKAFLLIQLTWSTAKALISLLYACFKGAKQPTLSGCRMWDKCGGIQRVIILFSSQRS